MKRTDLVTCVLTVDLSNSLAFLSIRGRQTLESCDMSYASVCVVHALSS